MMMIPGPDLMRRWCICEVSAAWEERLLFIDKPVQRVGLILRRCRGGYVAEREVVPAGTGKDTKAQQVLHRHDKHIYQRSVGGPPDAFTHAYAGPMLTTSAKVEWLTRECPPLLLDTSIPYNRRRGTKPETRGK